MPRLIHWDYFKNLNEINEMILNEHFYDDELASADQIVSITYDSNQGAYVVFWKSRTDNVCQNVEDDIDLNIDKCLSCCKWSYSDSSCLLSFPYDRHCRTNGFCYYSNESLL